MHVLRVGAASGAGTSRYRSLRGVYWRPVRGRPRRSTIGAVAQLVERIVRNDEVGSSTLLRSIPSKTSIFIGVFSLLGRGGKRLKTARGRIGGERSGHQTC